MAQKKDSQVSKDKSSKKTQNESSSTAPRPAPAFTSTLQNDETDFPRGGGSSLTAFEFKQVREEGRREAENEAKHQASKGEKRKRQMSDRQAKRLKKNEDAKKKEERDKDNIREYFVAFFCSMVC